MHSERILPLRERDLARPVKLRFAHPKGFNRASESEIRQNSLTEESCPAGLSMLERSGNPAKQDRVLFKMWTEKRPIIDLGSKPSEWILGPKAESNLRYDC